MKTLVTGATGFIGTHLVQNLVKQGREIRCLVRETSNTQYLVDLGVELFYGDLLNKDSLKAIAKDINIVYHLAGEVYSKRCKDFYRINLKGTQNLVEVCLPENIDRFVFLSSIAAVGPNRKHDILLDEQSPCKPLDPYGKSKLQAEKLLIKSFERYSFPVIIVRAPTVYGPLGQPKIITKILRMVQTGRVLIVGDKKSLRSMCYIDNLIQGLVTIEQFDKAISEIYFLSDERPYTYEEIFQTVSENFETNIKETHLPSLTGKVCGLLFKGLTKVGFYSLPLYMAWHMILDMACDISKAKKQLNYRPYIDIKEGVMSAIKYFLKKESD